MEVAETTIMKQANFLWKLFGQQNKLASLEAMYDPGNDLIIVV